MHVAYLRYLIYMPSLICIKIRFDGFFLAGRGGGGGLVGFFIVSPPGGSIEMEAVSTGLATGKTGPDWSLICIIMVAVISAAASAELRNAASTGCRHRRGRK